jgi:S1-C subfamily serine protease
MGKSLRLLALAVSLILGGVSGAHASKPEDLAKKLNAAVFPFYTQENSQKPIQFSCTITMYQKTDVGYLGVTASHCVSDEDDKAAKYFVKIHGDLISAQLLAVDGETTDVAILGIATKEELGTMPLGDSSKLEQGEDIVYMGCPMGLGKLFFRGSVVETHIEDYEGSWEANDKDDILVQIPAAGGSSGSAIISQKQEAIVAILVAVVIPKNGGVIVTVAVPVKAVQELIHLYQSGASISPKDPEQENILNNIFGPPPAPRKH